MDLQEAIDDRVKSERAENMKTSEQLALGELILLFEALPDKDDKVQFDFGYFYPTDLSSWRGSYDELSLGYTDHDVIDAPTVKDMLQELKCAIGETYCGYKGGDFVMGKATPVWVSNYGESNNTAIVGIMRLDWGRIIIETKWLEYC